MNYIKNGAFLGYKGVIATFVAAVVVSAVLAVPQSHVHAYDGDFGLGDSTEYTGFDSYSYDVYEPYDNSGYSYDVYEPYDNDQYSYDVYEPYDNDQYSYDVYEPYDDNQDNYYQDDYGYNGGSSYSDGGYSYGGSSYGGSSIGRSIGYSYTPTTYRPPTYNPPTYNPPTYNPPTYHNTPSNTTNNTCVNNSCNNVDNSVTNINNSVNHNNSDNVTVATVTPVAQAPIQYQVQYVQPIVQQHAYCTITLTNYNNNAYGSYGYNQLATLTWSATGATSGYISPTVGSVSTYGSMQVYPTNGQTYTMTVYGQGGSATCSTQPYYVAVAPVISNPTPYVSLSQIPYTGLDFGALGNSIYWLALVAFAGAAAYLVLYFQGGAVAVLGLNKANRPQIEMPRITVTRAPAVASAPAAVTAEAPVVSPIQISANVAQAPASDTMQVILSKAGSAPRIVISRA